MKEEIFNLAAEGFLCEDCLTEIDGQEIGEFRRCKSCHIKEARS